MLPADPFETLDHEGVGRLLRIAVGLGRAARPGRTTGVCGEHGGDQDFVPTRADLGLDYVSCSPYRLPVARLAAAHAALGAGRAPRPREGAGWLASVEEAVMRIRDWMTRHPVTVTPQTSVLYARRLLESNRIRHLPVVTEGDRLVGIVSDRDVMLRDGEVIDALVAARSDLASGRYRRLDGVMSTPARVVRPDDPIVLAVDLCLRWRLGALPVVDRGHLVGIITTTDCLRAFARVLAAQPGAVRPVDGDALLPEQGG